jgi:hypothetical protein
VHVDDDCCGHTMPILLKNCSEFVVYFLQPTPACDMAYCAGHMVPCPLGLESDTGFTPCQCECKNTIIYLTIKFLQIPIQIKSCCFVC